MSLQLMRVLGSQRVYNSLGCVQKRFYSETTSKKLSYFHKNTNYKLLNKTIGQVVDKSAETYGTNEAFVFCEQNIRKNFIELKNDVDNFAAGLIAIGLEKGDRIGIWSPNKYEWIVTQYAAAKAGLILVSINTANQARELNYALKKVNARALVCTEQFKSLNYYNTLKTIIPSIETSSPGQIKDSLDLSHVIMISDKEFRGTFKFSDVAAAGNKTHFKILNELQNLIDTDEPAAILFTSGTTGNPKAATLSHFSIINDSYSYSKRVGLLDKSRRICIPLPLFHCFAMVLGSVSGLQFGSSQIFPNSSYSLENFAKTLQKEKCTMLYGAPTIYVDLLNLPNLSDFDFSAIDGAIIGGTTVPPELIKKVTSKLKMRGVLSGYGTTECSPAIATPSIHEPIEIRANTVGTPLANTEVKVVDTATNLTVPCGEVGELCVRGAIVMLGYWNDPEKTDECILKSRWYRTGDLGTVDEAGRVKIIGRLKDLIIRGGENVYPTEIEDVLQTHSKISAANVVGVPDARLGEEVCAFIQLNSGESLTEKEVKQFCQQELAQFKVPRFVKFVDQFPVSATGKVLKSEIRKLAAAEFVK